MFFIASRCRALNFSEYQLFVAYKPVIGNRLCYRKSKLDDTSHDGDLGGGQYLNACVWFEMLTGQSCIGNTYRPDYELSEEKIAILQQAAHKAVLAERG